MDHADLKVNKDLVDLQDLKVVKDLVDLQDFQDLWDHQDVQVKIAKELKKLLIKSTNYRKTAEY
jgi:hypothetical protein